METRELKIGDYIYWGGIVMKLSESHMVSLLKNPKAKKYPKPIPLTEEWLLKFGFDLEDNDLYILVVKTSNKYRMDLWTRTERNLTIWLSVSQGNDPDQTDTELKHIKHVHQLQNLYFALTEEELTIKENDKIKH